MKTILKHIFSDYKNLAVLGIAGVVIGAAVGILEALFGLVLQACTGIRAAHLYLLAPFLPGAGILIAVLYRRLGKKASQGMKLVFRVGLGDDRGLPVRMIPLAMISTWLTHLCGGSAGREGVAIQIGAAVSDNIDRLVKKKWTVEKGEKIFLLTGMAAGFAGLFQTPLAAVFFALEVLVVGELEYSALFPAAAAAFTASTVSGRLGLTNFHHVLETALPFDMTLLLQMAVLGILFGIAGSCFAQGIRFMRLRMTFWFEGHPYRKAVLMGIILAAAMLLLHAGRYAGTGENLVELGFSGGKIYGYDWILKAVLTILTLSSGFIGGEVAPLFAIGTCLGAVLAPLFGLPPEFVMALGYAAVFGSGTNTLLASILIGCEVFGYGMLPYFFVTCIMAYLFNWNKSIFTSQQKSLVHYFRHIQRKKKAGP